MGRLISDRMSYRNHYMCSGEATSLYKSKNVFLMCLKIFQKYKHFKRLLGAAALQNCSNICKFNIKIQILRLVTLAVLEAEYPHPLI